MRLATATLVWFLCTLAPYAGELPYGLSSANARVAVCFTPGDTCDTDIVGAIDRAENIIRVQAYYLTSTRILAAFRKALERGVTVEAVLDRVNAAKKTAAANYLYMAGAKVWIDNDVKIAHGKVIMIDNWLVISGSYNFTKSAQTQNSENVMFVDSPDMYRYFERNWYSRQSQSDQYAP